MRYILTTVIFICTMMVNVIAQKTVINMENAPDFRYPQTVSKNAIDAYDKAVAKGDCNKALQSLIQYALAETSRSDSAMSDVMERCESLYKKCDKPEYRVMIDHLRSRLCMAFSYEDYTQREHYQEEARKYHANARQLAEGLSVKTRDMGNGLIVADDWGWRIIPTLSDYLRQWEIDNHEYLGQWVGDRELFTAWNAQLIVGDDNATQMYLEYKLVMEMDIESRYDALKQYISKYPESPYVAECRRDVAVMEREFVSIGYDDIVASGQEIEVRVKMTNLHDCTLSLYRIPEVVATDKNNRYNINTFEHVADIPVHTDEGVIPFRDVEVKAYFAPQRYGKYIILQSFTDRYGKLCREEILEEYQIRRNKLVVTDLAAYTIAEGNTHSTLVVVDRTTGKPQKGVTVEFTRLQTCITGKDGVVTVPKNEAYSYRLRRGDDRYSDYVDRSKASNVLPDKRTSVNIFTDLKIYRPGETLQGTVVAYMVDASQREPVSGGKIRVILKDAGNNKVDSLTLTCDQMGQVTFSMPIPTDRMNGYWRLECEVKDSDSTNKTPYGRSSLGFEVSEYKAPTFAIDLTQTAGVQQAGESAWVKGKVTTFTGMPVADAEVQMTLSRRSWWWRERTPFDNKQLTGKTDAEGRFEMECPAEWMQVDPNECYRYEAEVSCTNTAGERHDARCSFRVGTAKVLILESGDYLLPEDGILTMPVVYRSSETDAEPEKCHYMLKPVNDTTVVAQEGDFMSNEPKMDWSKVPSGQYRFEATIVGADGAGKAEATLTLYRESDKVSPSSKVLWIPEPSRKVGKDGKTDILIGTSQECYIYIVAASRTRIEKTGDRWLHYKPGIHHLRLPMPDGPDDILSIQMVTMRNGRTYTESITMKSPRKQKLHLAVTSFRDMTIPGTKETWSLRLTDQDGNPVKDGRLILEAYSKALKQLAPNNWSMTTGLLYSKLFSLETEYVGTNYAYQRGSDIDIEIIEPKLPRLWLWGVEFFSRGGVEDCCIAEPNIVTEEESIPVYALTRNNHAAMMLSSRKAGSAESAAEDSDTEVSQPEITMRTEDLHVALWEPQLTSDSDGNVTVTFDVPQQNATWVVQALAYSKSMVTDSWSGELLVQRPLMVQPMLPRFVRQGDKAVLKAQVMNSTQETLNPHIVLEVFDPRTDNVMHVNEIDAEVPAKGTVVAEVVCEVPMDSPYVGFRVKATTADGSGDGEQRLLPVASAVQPVIETTPFYLQPDVAGTEHSINAGDKSGRLTLEFCTNPTWYCVTALPSMIDEDAITSIGLAHDLYALSIAEMLVTVHPEIDQALDTWMQEHKEYNPLESQLSQNADLKIVTLKASPWLSAAEWQTSRMRALKQLMDKSRNRALYDKMINRLQKLQHSDGGFTWIDYKGCESSEWATSIVVELIGELQHLGCLEDDVQLMQMAQRAIDYMERKVVEREQYYKDHKMTVSYSEFQSFAYVRGLFVDSYPVKDAKVQELLDKTIKAMSATWGKNSLSEKAFMAITLHRFGKTKTAKDIIESIRQFSIINPRKGMYWERLKDGFWFHPVAATATILQAMSEVDPRTEELNQIRQWLLLEKQTSDWGSSSLASDAVFALLSTGDNWLRQIGDTPFTITVDGTKVDVSPSDQYLGYVRMDLLSGARHVRVDRNIGTPAWGALYHQYVAPMTDIKESAVPEVSIRKSLLVQDADGKWIPADTLRVGQRVQVRLDVHADKALEYVTINDERPAMLEPVDQTSHYEWSQLCGYFHETKDQVTNLFISRLPAGNHIFTYQCNVTHEGTFLSGIATLQSQYAPQFTAHSAGRKMTVK